MEADLWRLVAVRVAQDAAAGEKKSKAQKARGGSFAGQGDAPGGLGKKIIAPGRRREIVHWVQSQFGVSERRRCAADG